jgi:hypothetical protein
MADVKDILGISRDNGAGEPGPSSRKEKAKELRERPKGMSRETYNLLYRTHPIPQGELLSEIAKKEEPKTGPSYTQVRCIPLLVQSRGLHCSPAWRSAAFNPEREIPEARKHGGPQLRIFCKSSGWQA